MPIPELHKMDQIRRLWWLHDSFWHAAVLREMGVERANRINLEATEKAGLIHNTNNFTGNLIFICNCCGCCCEFVKMIKELGNTAVLAYSNFEVAIDESSCTGCGDCLERCSMEALSLVDDVVVVKKEHCVGCGNCVSACPTETLSMVRRSNTIPPKGGMTMGGLAV